MTTNHRILLVEDDEVDAESVMRRLASRHAHERDVHFETRHVVSLGAARQALAEHEFDAILLDLGLPDSSGLESVRLLRDDGTEAAIIVLTMLANEQVGIEALRLGVEDFLAKDVVDSEGLVRSLLFAVERSRLRRAERRIREQDREHRAAGVVQEHLLPKAPPVLPGFDIAGRCTPADVVGGDLYDFVPLEDGRLAIVVADVAGHGLPAALIMAGFRQVVRTLLRENVDLEHVANVANESMHRETPDFSFVTMLLACLDPYERTIDYIGAGHQAVVSRASESVVMDSTCMALGFGSNVEIGAGRVQLQVGDVLVIPTDGLSETLLSPDEMFGMDRLAGVVDVRRTLPAEEIVEAVYTEVEAASYLDTADDDRTLVVVRVLEEFVQR